MTMGDESLYAAMTMPVVMGPILEKLERRDMAAAQTLRQSLKRAEYEQPGFVYELVRGLLEKADIGGSINYSEALLRLEGSNNSNEFRVPRTDVVFKELNDRSAALKAILSRIPDEIYERRKFLDTIKDIASAIKFLLDAVGRVFDHIHGQDNKQILDQRKREFVRYSKRFSNTLKDFFKNNEKNEVFKSANCLIHQTNMIMREVKKASS